MCIRDRDKVPLKLLIPLSIQHMFAMFGASVLVPFVFGINPAIVLFMNGVGTLLFIVLTKGKAPAYLGSSFAFLAPAGIVIEKYGYADALGCLLYTSDIKGYWLWKKSICSEAPWGRRCKTPYYGHGHHKRNRSLCP